MANKPLKSIKFPGLNDTYTVPEVDATLATTGAAADAKKVGDEINDLKADLNKHVLAPNPSEYNNLVANLAGQNIIAVVTLNAGWEDIPVTGMLVNTQYSQNYDIQTIYDTSKAGNVVTYRTVNRLTKVPFTEWKTVGGSGLSDDAKSALLACFDNVAWASANGRQLYNNLRIALGYAQYPAISAKYEPGHHVVRAGDDITSLKEYITVTYYADASSSGIEIDASNYSVSGNLSVGLNTLTVSYNNLIDTISVTAEQNDIPSAYTPYDYIGTRSEEELATIPTFEQITSAKRLKLSASVPRNTVYLPLKNYSDLWGMNYEFNADHFR